MTEAVLCPKTKYGDGASHKRRYEGSSLAERDGWLFWTPPGGGQVGRWQLQVGSAQRQAARLTHVQADMMVGARGAGIVLDRYVLLDSAGLLLASFPAERDGSIASGPNPWFQADHVASFAAAAGLTFEEVQIVRPQELAARFPGLYKHTTYALWFSYITPLVFALGALALVGVAVFNVVEPKPSATFIGTFVICTLLLAAGLLLGGLAVLLFPPVFGRVLAREKRRHPERFNRH
jgi:hypothetical protein